LVHLPKEAPNLLGPDDVVLVTGGGKGIGAECALSTARSCRGAVAILGRSDPEDDEELADNLQRMTGTGVRHVYVRADVNDAGQVRRAVARVEEDLGPVTAIVHSAGRNEPTPIGKLDEKVLLETMRPKVAGLRNLLAAVGEHQLKLLVTFGSIIARMGL